MLASAAVGASLWAVLTAAIAARVAADGGQLPSSESVVIAGVFPSTYPNASLLHKRVAPEAQLIECSFWESESVMAKIHDCTAFGF